MVGCTQNENVNDEGYQNIENQQQEGLNNNEINNANTIFVPKLYENKDWVYDAEYERNVEAASYLTEFDETYYAKDIKVPFINVDSAISNTYNEEIKNVFDNAINMYNEGVGNKLTYVDICDYQKYVNGNVLSVLLKYGVGATDVVHPQYYTYNMDLKSGNELSYENAYKEAGINTSDIETKVENAIIEKLNEKMSSFSSDNYPMGTNFDTYKNESISNYKDAVNDNTLKCFLSDNGTLNVIVKLSIPVGNGEFDTIINLK